ncbi:MAG: hypothetical protein ABS36_02565 [Acidobacteria bacterium SCN 69-37]|nr:MAG: hypothetical protein ABS36_02565 [Acidobacteria bacterium SCN 69-37]
MRRGLLVSLTVIVAFGAVVGVAEQGSKIQVLQASWSDGTAAVDVRQQVAQACDGLTACTAPVNSLSLPLPSGRRVVKSLSVTYRCGSRTMTAASREYLNFRLDCGSDSAQPTTLIDFRVDQGPSCDSLGGSEQMLLPAGYNYCWHHVFEFSQAGNSSSTVARLGNGISVDWHVAPGGFPCPTFGGRGWMEKVFIVAGSLPGESCPVRP